MFASIVIENKSKYTDTFYTYETGELFVNPGDKVRVPFGKKEVYGYVFDVTDEKPDEEFEIKTILEVDEENSLNPEIVKTAAWMKSRYAIKYYDALKLFIPKGKAAKPGKEKEPYKDLISRYSKPEHFTSEQENAISVISESIEKNTNDIFLLHGVTSSGKTEVYMESISKALEMGKTAIMLVPEISLTTQVIERFAGRFGKENIAVLHSKLTERERFDEWMRLKTGKAKIAIGARIAVFSPLENIGVIIMDEEHEATYKADMSPKFDTLDVAVKRLKTYNGVLVLGSATPSVTSYERAKEGIYRLICLKERYNKTPLPMIHIVDMREELRNGNASILSEKLNRYICSALDSKKQVILLQNRRGYSNFVSCRECGYVMKCPECGISLTYHKKEDKMICHYCGKKYDVPKVCPDCKSKKIKLVGFGTEQVEEVISSAFPNAVVDRLDLDTVTKRSELDSILKRFEDKKTDILVGTQLVAKGLDFDNVAVVGVLLADTTLNLPDYRSQERTFQLVTQVSGRAGRGDEQGNVVVQTYEPENFTFKACMNHDYEMFYNDEIKIREFMNYPPFGDIIMVNFTSNDEELCDATSDRFTKYMKNCLKTQDKGLEKGVMNPKVAFNFKGQDSFRTYVLIKCPKGERNRYVYYIDNFQSLLFNERLKVNVVCDVNPYSIV